ncbi:MAG: flagellar biosynthesis anti-sigma factor FlgM [Phycisphaerales bacterium]
MSTLSSVNSLSNGSNVGALRAAFRRPVEVSAPAVEGRTDSVELSTEARPIQGVPYGRIPEQGFDAAKVERIRTQIREGTYLSPDRFDAALEKLRADLDLLP